MGIHPRSLVWAAVVLLCAGCTRSRQRVDDAEGLVDAGPDQGESSWRRMPESGERDPSPPTVVGDAGDAAADPVAADAGLAFDAGPAFDAGLERFDCEGDDAVAAPAIVGHSLDVFWQAQRELSAGGVDVVLPGRLDPAQCPPLAYDVALPLGSAYAYVRPTPEGDCEVWLGGEHESPQYEGWPTSYCRFEPGCLPVTLELGDALCGPLSIDSNRCVP